MVCGIKPERNLCSGSSPLPSLYRLESWIAIRVFQHAFEKKKRTARERRFLVLEMQK
jgi:hypothetical protein